MNHSIIIIILTVVISIVALLKDLEYVKETKWLFNGLIASILTLFIISSATQIIDNKNKEELISKQNIKINTLVARQKESLFIAKDIKHEIEMGNNNHTVKLDKLIKLLMKDSPLDVESNRDSPLLVSTFAPTNTLDDNNDREAEKLFYEQVDYIIHQGVISIKDDKKLQYTERNIIIDKVIMHDDIQKLVTGTPKLFLENRRIDLHSKHIIANINKANTPSQILRAFGKPEKIKITSERVNLDYDLISFEFYKKSLKEVNFEISEDAMHLKDGIYDHDLESLISLYGSPQFTKGRTVYYEFEHVDVEFNPRLSTADLIVTFR